MLSPPRRGASTGKPAGLSRTSASASMNRMRSERFTSRHCEERSDEAIQESKRGPDCFVPLAMTPIKPWLWMIL